MDIDTTIIHLGSPQGTSSAPRVATFDEAFGESSELRGKGRARRAARREDRQDKKLERKTSRVEHKDEAKRAKVDARQSRRSDKKSGRQGMRIERRSTRKDSRQDIRDEQQGRRVARRQTGTDARQTRKDTKSRREQERDAAAIEAADKLDRLYPEESEQATEQESNESSPQGNGSSQSGGSQSQPQGNGGGSQSQSDDDYYEDEEEEEDVYTDDDDFNNAPLDEDEDDYYDEDEEGYDDEDEEDDAPYESYSFEGEIGENIDVVGELDVPKGVADAARKIEWNQEYCSRLQDKSSSFNGDNKAIHMEIAKCKNRISELQKQLKDYVNFYGQYDAADGQFRGDNANNASKRGIERRYAHVVRARNIAKKERNSVSKNPHPTKGAVKQSRSLTMVEQDLQPEFSTQKIRIPAKTSSAEGIGAPDLKYENDIEVYLGADGSSSSKEKTTIPVKQIVIGVGFAILAIVLLKKFKVI